MEFALIDDMELLGVGDSASAKPTTVDQVTVATSVTSSFESLPVPPISPLVEDGRKATNSLQPKQMKGTSGSLLQDTKHQPPTVSSSDEDDILIPLKNSEPLPKMKAPPPMSFAHLAPASAKNAPKSFAHLNPIKAAAAKGGGSLRRAVTAGAVLGGGSTCYAATADPLGVHPLASTSKNRQRERHERKMHSSFGELPMFAGLEPPSADMTPSEEKRVDFAPFALKRASTVSTPSKVDNLKQAAKLPERSSMGEELPSFASMKPPAKASSSSLPRRAVSVGVTTTPGVWNVPSKSVAMKMVEIAAMSSSMEERPSFSKTSGLQRAESVGGKRRGLRRATSTDGTSCPKAPPPHQDGKPFVKRLEEPL